jgi:hypothetical protein
VKLLKYLLFILVLIFALAIYASHELTREIEHYKGVAEMQDNIIRHQKMRIIELIQKMVKVENERPQIIELKAKMHDS